MANRTFSSEEIVAKLELARRLEAAGVSMTDVCRRLEVNELTYLRWYKKHSGLDAAAVSRLRQLEAENARLRRALQGIQQVVTDLDQGQEHRLVRPRLAAVGDGSAHAEG